MNGTRLLGALVICAGLCSPAWAGNPFSFTSLKTWTANLTGSSCDDGCGECHVCCREDACKVAQLICRLKTECKASRRERAAAKLDDYKCCCYPEIVPALIEALNNDCDDDVREEAAESLGELECCTPEVIAALEKALGDPADNVRDEAKEALEECGVCVVEVKPCRGCGGCDACGTCGCGQAQGEAYPAPASGESLYTPSTVPEAEGDPQARVIHPYHPHDLAASSHVSKPRRGLRRLFKFGRY